MNYTVYFSESVQSAFTTYSNYAVKHAESGLIKLKFRTPKPTYCHPVHKIQQLRCLQLIHREI